MWDLLFQIWNKSVRFDLVLCQDYLWILSLYKLLVAIISLNLFCSSVSTLLQCMRERVTNNNEMFLTETGGEDFHMLSNGFTFISTVSLKYFFLIYIKLHPSLHIIYFTIIFKMSSMVISFFKRILRFAPLFIGII